MKFCLSTWFLPLYLTYFSPPNFLRVSLVHPILLITPSLAIRSLPIHLHPPLSFPYVYIYFDFTSLKLIFIHPQTLQLFTSTSLPPSFLFCKFSTAIGSRLHRDKSRDDRSPTVMIFYFIVYTFHSSFHILSFIKVHLHIFTIILNIFCSLARLLDSFIKDMKEYIIIGVWSKVEQGGEEGSLHKYLLTPRSKQLPSH